MTEIQWLTTSRVGDAIEYTGEFLVMRDMAQERLLRMALAGDKPPFELCGRVVFYGGPTFVEGSMVLGPTTSRRMDKYLGFLLERGVTATVGKGDRTAHAVELMRKFCRPYLVAPSGCAAYLSSLIESWRVLAFDDLGPEAVYVVRVKNFPLLVYVDGSGRVLTGGADGT